MELQCDNTTSIFRILQDITWSTVTVDLVLYDGDVIYDMLLYAAAVLIALLLDLKG